MFADPSTSVISSPRAFLANGHPAAHLYSQPPKFADSSSIRLSAIRRCGFVVDSLNEVRVNVGQIKPFNFLQVLTSSVTVRDDVLPIELGDPGARKLPRMDLRSGAPDSNRLEQPRVHVGTVPVRRMGDYFDDYRLHPETKESSGCRGTAVRARNAGLLRRLGITVVARPGSAKKSIDWTRTRVGAWTLARARKCRRPRPACRMRDQTRYAS